MAIQEIKPRLSVGEVDLGASTDFLASSGYFEDKNGYDQITGWRTFKKEENLDIYVAGDAVVCIACFGHCVVDGIDLINRTPSELTSLLGSPDEIGEPVWVSDNLQQIPHEYFSLGLQIWFEADKVVSVFCNAVY